jgi:hypothetical protein
MVRPDDKPKQGPALARNRRSPLLLDVLAWELTNQLRGFKDGLV